MRTQLLLSGAAVLALALPVPSSAPPSRAAFPAPAEAYRQTAAAMRDAGGAYRVWAVGGRQFLGFDPAGDGTAVL